MVYRYDAEVVFQNGGAEPQEVLFTQNLGKDAKIVSENMVGKAKDVDTHQWRISVPVDGKITLTYSAEVPMQEQLCD